MKKIHLVSTLFLAIFLAGVCSSFRDFPDNPPNGYTGSGPATCGNCHSGGNFGSTVVILGVPTSITPNTTYAISVTATKTSGSTKKAGFQLNVLNGAGTTTGTLTSTSTNVRIESGYAEQAETSSFQNFVSTSGIATKTWTFDWTSPASSTNNTINFYVCAVLANGTGSTSGDQVVLNSATGTLSSASAPLIVTQLAKTNVTCLGGNNGTASVSATGGSGCSYTYLWSNGQNSQTATGLAAGTYTVTATCGASSGTASVSISQPATALTVSTTGSTLNCAGVNNGTVSATATGGGTTYTYLWSNNQTGPTLNNLSAGTYIVTVTDNNGCSQTKTATVGNPQNPVTASSTTTAATCVTAGSATATAVNGTAPYTFLWSNGQSDATASGLAAGNYTVTVTDNNGCKTTTTASVASNSTAPPAAISGISAITCAQPSGALNGPSGNYSYQWSTGESASSININTAGNYSLTVTDKGNGCTSSSAKTISSNTTSPMVSISGNTTLTCAQPTSILSASGGNTYKWSGPGVVSGTSASSVTVNAAGIYNVTVTNSANGCTNTGVTSVSTDFNAPAVPNISPANPVLSCTNTSIALISAPDALLHQWKFNGVQVGSGTSLNVTNPGTYTLLLTNLTNGCTASTTKLVNSSITSLSVSAGGGKITCATTTVNLTASAPGAVSFSWTGSGFSSALQNPVVSSSGTYIVLATDANGCTGSAQAIVSSDTQKPVVGASVSGSISCATPTVTLTASSSTPNLNYSWSSNTGFSKTGNPVATQQSGDFTVTATNPQNGCTSTAMIKVNASNDKPQLSTSAGTITCKDSIVDVSVSVTGNTTGLTYKWSGPLSFAGTKAIEKVTAAGDYGITVTASNGCTSTATVSVKLNTEAPNVTIESPKVFVCSKDTLTLTAKTAGIAKSYKWSDNNTTSTIKIQTAGLYLVTITGDNGCSGKGSIQIAEGKSPVILLSADSLTCSVTKITPQTLITWDVPVLPQWVGPNGFSAAVLQPDIRIPGTYTLSVQPTNGCPASATILVKENKVPPSISISGTTFSCDSTPVVLIAKSNAGNYRWKGFGVDNATNPMVTASKTGRYICFTQGSNGCISVDSTEVTIQNPPFAIDIQKSVVVNSTAGQSNGSVLPFIVGKENNFSYRWSNGIDTRNLTNISSGKYCLTITDTNGCSKSACFEVKSTVSTVDKYAWDEIEIRPNPVQENLYLTKKAGFKGKETVLYSDKGELVLHFDNVPDQIELTGIAAGWYFLKIVSENGQIIFKKVLKI